MGNTLLSEKDGASVSVKDEDELVIDNMVEEEAELNVVGCGMNSLGERDLWL